jgi:hypothetical protein
MGIKIPEDGGSKIIRNVGILPHHNLEDRDLNLLNCFYNLMVRNSIPCIKIMLSLSAKVGGPKKMLSSDITK